jgi:glycosyltransferase involved in cell wall biosynthesis
MPAARPLSICLVSDDFLPAATGVGIHVQRIGEGLVRRGHRMSLITTRRPGQAAREEWRGVQVHRTFTLKAFGFYQALPSRAFSARVFREHAVELVHLHYLGILLKRTERVARTFGLPQVYTYHMTADHLTQPWPMKPLRPWIERQIVEYCNRFQLVIVPSAQLMARIEADGVHAPTRYITNPVVFDTPQKVEPAPRPAGFVVLYAGRLNPEKNLPLLLRAFRELLGKCPDAALWIAGTGDQRGRLEAMAVSLGIFPRVRFLGFLEHADLARHYAACDVFVLPSVVETQGLVAMEAMRFARPVIVTHAIVSARELVDDGVNGFIVAPDAPAQLAEKLAILAADPALRERLGNAGLQRSLAGSPETVVGALEEAYAAAVQGCAGRGR